MTQVLRTHISLPAGFRPGDVLSLHARDSQQLAERVEDFTIHKGITWQGKPALLQLRMDPAVALASLHIDRVDAADAADAGEAGEADALQAMLSRMLGLSASVPQFEQQFAPHPVMGKLLRAQTGLRVPASSTPFEALVWAITGQQISVAAAIALRRRLIEAAGVRHSSGMLCHPDAQALALLTPEQLRGAGFSISKIATLERVCAAVLDGSLPLDSWAAEPLQAERAQALEAALLAIKGIGPWTVHYALLRGFGWLDGSLHGDVAVRNALARLLDLPSVSQSDAEQWLAAFAPWRALVAAHLWASLSAKSY